jgi:hypothetical protein
MSGPAVTVALPIHRADEMLRAAFDCLIRQSLRDIEILIVLNGSDAATYRLAGALAATDSRARIIELPEANLAAALNVALEAARAPLVARMDADDLCPPERLALQAERMRAEPALAALGCAWEVVSPDLAPLATIRPPTDPAAARWRLLLGNPFAHGSMMLRREMVMAAGGYDTRCARAQDYELWIRLSRTASLCALPQVLYRHRTRTPAEPVGSTPEQAAIASRAMLAAWQALPEGDAGEVAAALAPALERGSRPGAALHQLESLLSTAPSRSALLAWLHAQWANPPAPRRAMETCRRARLREVAAELRSAGADRVWIWGAGDHTRWLLDHADLLAVPIAGIVDNALAGQARFDRTIASPDEIPAGQTVLLSSDWHEDEMWDRSAPQRACGVQVIRFYAG